MKKALALLLSLLVAFSMLSVVAVAGDDAEEGLVNIIFVVDGVTVADVKIQPGDTLAPVTPDNPEKQDTETIRYTFKGWRSSQDGNLYYKSTIPNPDGSVAQITYTAEFTEEDISEYQSLWNLIESIFERINLIFEYFAKIFGW